LILIAEYMKKTKLERIHKRQVLVKNKVAYYRTIENMLNFSDKFEQVIKLVQECVLSPEDFEIQVTESSII
jgi:hypothetical protein